MSVAAARVPYAAYNLFQWSHQLQQAPQERVQLCGAADTAADTAAAHSCILGNVWDGVGPGYCAGDRSILSPGLAEHRPDLGEANAGEHHTWNFTHTHLYRREIMFLFYIRVSAP